MPSQLLTIPAAAALLSVSRWTIYRLIADGEIKATKLPTKRGELRIPASELDQFIGRNAAA